MLEDFSKRDFAVLFVALVVVCGLSAWGSIYVIKTYLIGERNDPLAPRWKAGRIKVDVASDGSTSVDVRCADDEPMQACADLTRDVVDRIKAPK
jgi:hypothetical protein